MKFFIILINVLIISCNVSASTIKGIEIPSPVYVKTPNYIKTNVVHISQNDHNSCATTAAAMIVSHYEGLDKKPLDKEAAWNISGTKEKAVLTYGNDMDGLKRIATHYGYKSEYVEQLTVYDLEYLLSQGIFIIINVKAKKTGLATHALLVTGYNKRKKRFFINNPANKNNNNLNYSDLNACWAANLSTPRGMSYRSGFIIYPKTYNVTPSE